ncbi:hypothetical protein OCA8868_02483 [Octadecabacter ascidiaceicola]|uniref:Uncharacterized protein n=1 Tax=Octadecabacter ascidiaceicola TaxID=1655543 RepID=A0A238KGV6_9RHOB|nr:hypothetical protein OCA8868_02483 [Octadecabacter ascidiaceicola]
MWQQWGVANIYPKLLGQIVSRVKWGIMMLRTISVGTHVQVQGILVKTLANGRVVVSVGDREFEGTPVTRLN